MEHLRLNPHQAAPPMMKCGHAANGTHEGRPVCVICFDSGTDWKTPVAVPPDLTGRTARCDYYKACGSQKPSSTSLAFFTHRPQQEFDMYYCGCRGWD